MKFRVFWDVAPCSHVDVDQRFIGAYCLHHQVDEFIALIMEAVRTCESRSTSTRLHGATYQNTLNFKSIVICANVNKMYVSAPTMMVSFF
jgi:hypothetical protein